MRTLRIIALIFVFTFVAWGSQVWAAETGKSTLVQVRSTKKVKAGWAPYPPYCSINLSTGKVEGFYVDLFEAIAGEVGWKVTWVESTWGTMISDLKAGKFHVMAGPIFRTIGRATEVAFTVPIDYYGLSAIVRTGDNRFKEITDLNRSDVTIAVTTGEIGYDYSKRHLPKAKLIVKQTGDISLAMVDVVQKRADASIADFYTVRQFAEKHKGKVRDLFADEPFGVVGAGYFVLPGETEWLQFLNTSIEWLLSSGTTKELASKYDLPSFLRK